MKVTKIATLAIIVVAIVQVVIFLKPELAPMAWQISIAASIVMGIIAAVTKAITDMTWFEIIVAIIAALPVNIMGKYGQQAIGLIK